MSTNRDWSKLVEAVATMRDRQAFAEIFDYFVPRLENYLTKLGLDGASAQEVSQDTMITLWNKAQLFDATKSSLATWLYRIARNRRIDLSRRNRLDYLDPKDRSFTQIADPQLSIELRIDHIYREERMRAALTQLPEEQAELIRLAFFSGRSHSEIAQATGLPLGTVKSRIRLAFSRLRRSLEADGIVEAG